MPWLFLLLLPPSDALMISRLGGRLHVALSGESEGGGRGQGVGGAAW